MTMPTDRRPRGLIPFAGPAGTDETRPTGLPPAIFGRTLRFARLPLGGRSVGVAAR